MSCPTETARQIRRDSWGFEVHTATFAHPVDQLRFLDIDSATDAEYDKSILVTVSDQIIEGGVTVGRTRGPFLPYFGSHTKEKTIKPTFAPMPSVTVLRAAIRMRTLLSWAYKAGDDKLVSFVKSFLDAKSIDVSTVSPVVTGGNIFHRLSSVMSTRGCLTSLEANQVTHVRFSTSGMEYYKKDQKDWTIFFQEVFLFISWYLVNFSRKNKLSVPRTLLAALECAF